VIGEQVHQRFLLRAGMMKKALILQRAQVLFGTARSSR
jgi:hypothetical protein